MLYTLVVGVILAANHVAFPLAVPIILVAVLLKGLAEIALRTSWITGGPSPYALYVENLEKSGSAPQAPWRTYLLQMLVFGALIGTAGFAIASLIF